MVQLGERLARYLPLLVALGLVAVPVWPGHLNADGLNQALQASGKIPLTNMHAPLLQASWRLVYPLGVGVGWILVLQASSFLLGSYLILRAAFRPVTASVVAALLSLSPPVYGMLGSVWRDTWYGALIVLTFGLLALAARSEGRERTLALVAAGAAAWLTLAARQNAAPAVVFALAGAAWLVRRQRPVARSRRTRAAFAAAGVGVVATLAMIGSQSAVMAAVGVRDRNPEQFLYVYDLAAMSHRAGRNLFPARLIPDRGVGIVNAVYDPDSMDRWSWFPPAPLHGDLTGARLAALRAGWRHAVEQDPLRYLAERTVLSLRQLGLTRQARYVHQPVIDQNPWFRVRFPRLDARANRYVGHFTTPANDGRSPIFRVWVYQLLALAGGLWLLRRRSTRAALAVAAAGVSTVGYQAGLFFAAPGTQYRFEISVVALGVLVALVALRVERGHRRERAGAAS